MQRGLLDAGEPATSNFCHERALYAKGYASIAGCDEAGRGPLAGPVVAASVILPPSCNPEIFLDSKKLSHTRRLALYRLLIEHGAPLGIGIVSVATIGRINILQASLLAMQRSVLQLETDGRQPDFVLVDGKFEIPTLATPQCALIKGETHSASIAAASIVAKVTRDAIMDELDKEYPEYNFKQHKGYPTKEHRRAIAAWGPSAVHRRTFAGVREFVK